MRPWCNGSTRDSKPLSVGSNPTGRAIEVKMSTFRVEDNVLLADRHQEVNCIFCGEKFYGRFRLLYCSNEDANSIFDKLEKAEYTCEKCLTLIRFQE
jgi:hypothetical protein